MGAVCRFVTTNDNVVPAGDSCEHSKQTGLELCRPFCHSVPQSILAALLWCPCRRLDFCTPTVRGRKGAQMHTHANCFHCQEGIDTLLNTKSRAINKWSDAKWLSGFTPLHSILISMVTGPLPYSGALLQAILLLVEGKQVNTLVNNE